MTPLILFVGFLGAGKTTFLRTLLPHLTSAGLAPQVLINDYQNARLDAATMRGLADSIISISGSCVCCGSREKLFGALEDATLTEKTLMLVEVNGTADAAQLIEMLTGDSRAIRYTLPWQISLVDAKRWQKRHQHNWLESDQVITATHFVLSHDSEVVGPRRSEVRWAVGRLNPRAPWVEVEGLAKELITLRADAHSLPRRVLGGEEPRKQEHSHPHAAHHFASMEVRLMHGISRAALEEFLRTLPPEVVRAKGILQLAGQHREYTFFDYLGENHASVLRNYNGEPEIPPMMLMVGSHLPQEIIRRAVADLIAPLPML